VKSSGGRSSRGEDIGGLRGVWLVRYGVDEGDGCGKGLVL
jgi:hypothetical protein